MLIQNQSKIETRRFQRSRKAKTTMKAAVIAEPEQCLLVETEMPMPAENQVRIRLQGCGVCASNLPVWEGKPWFSYPLEPGKPGHEGWGVIDAVGTEVTGFAPGERVAFLSDHAYAEYDVADVDALVRLPETLADVPVPGEPLGCAMNVFERSEIKHGQAVAIVGIGFLGALLTSLCANAGAKVIAISRRTSALQTAEKMGAAHLVVMDDHWRIVEEVKGLTNGEGCDCVIEAVGLQWPLDLASELTKVRGRLVVAGYHQDGPRQINMQLWNWRGLDVINAHEREQKRYTNGIQAAVEAVAAGRLDPLPLITHRFQLKQLTEAMKLMQKRPDGFMKGIIHF